jgi:protoporphyrinogen oxidase
VKKSYDWIVIGGGFKSMVAAYALASKGFSILLLENGKSLGGFMAPIRWGDFWIDKGPQFFDNFSEEDKNFIVEMVGENVLEDIGFAYASYLNGTKTDGFAIPDWRAKGEGFSNKIFADIIQRRLNSSGPPAHFDTFDDVLLYDGGEVLVDEFRQMTRKFLRTEAKNLSPHANRMVTYLGRKLLFDQDISVDLKKSPIIDGFLAAQKKGVSETRYNLYPKGSNLETVRIAMEKALKTAGVDVLLNNSLLSVDADTKSCSFNDGSANYGSLFFGCDAREAEKLLFATQTLLDQTHMLPEIFHCFTVPRKSMDEAYYLVDYDPSHLSTRMTNFSNYMNAYDDEDYGIFCVEQAIERDDADWVTPDRMQGRIFEEARETGNVTCDHFKSAKSFRIPVTYKVPLTGFVDANDHLLSKVTEKFGSDVVIPNSLSLTRKETLDDLRTLEIL